MLRVRDTDSRTAVDSAGIDSAAVVDEVTGEVGYGALGFRLLAAGIAVSCLWMTAMAVIAMAVARPEEWRHPLSIVGAVGVPIATLLMLAGVERMPGIGEQPMTRLRRRVDGLLMTPAIFLSCWILVGIVWNGGRQIQPYSHWAVWVGAPPVLTAIAALAFATVMFLRTTNAPPAVTLLVSGVVGTAVGGAGLVVAVLAGTPVEILAGGGVLGAGLVLLARAGVLRAQLMTPVAEVSPGWAMSGITVCVALVMIIIQVLATGSLDAVGAAAGVLTGFAMVARQGLALADANRLSQRLKDDEASLRDMAYTDALTGVANRRQLLRILNEDAVGGPPCVLLAIDLDGFKNINDLRGHDVGDAVLVEVAQRLRMNLRPGDIAARMGGDEFAVLMWAGVDDATTAARRLLIALGQPYHTDAGSVFVSASIGLAGCRSANDIAGLLRNADLALRFAKQRGKDRVELYDAAYDEWLRRRTGIEHELRGAIVRDELSLVFQPIVSLPEGKPVGVEALLRWNHPRLGPVPPDEFIPIAEEAGLISRLDHWVLHQACRRLGRWLADGHDLWLSVNISVRELHLVDYVSQVTETLRTHRIPPERLVLEITEHSVALDIDDLVAQLEELRSVGIRIALDDFGAGYSSLGQLRHLPVDILKIDRSLVGDPARGSSREAAPLVDVVVRLGNRLGLDVIAEGVAEPAERRVVEGAGCRLGQGDLFGRAMPAEHLEAMLVEAAGGAVPAVREVVPTPGVPVTTPVRRPRQPRRTVQDVGLLD